jgi:hypothetical protein
MSPSAQGGWIGQARRIFAVRRRLLNGIAGGDAFASLLSAMQAKRGRRRQPIGQNRKGLPAGMTDSAPYPNALVPVIVGIAKPLPMADDRAVEANRTSPRQEIQRNYPGSMLSFASGSAIKIITAGVKAAADRPCQVSI